MFAYQQHNGWVEAICGSMFSGKTSELIRRLTRSDFAKQKTLLFRIDFDNRYSEKAVVSHNGDSKPAIVVENSKQILKHVTEETSVVGIDEGNFFDSELTEVCETLANRGVRVIVAGLDLDFMGKPFGPMPQILSVAEIVTKLQAVCIKCWEPATRSQRLTKGPDQIMVGAAETYEARCRFCFDPPKKENEP